MKRQSEGNRRNQKGVRDMRRIWIPCLLVVLLLAGCTEESGAASEPGYLQISAQQAKDLMDQQPDAVILDVREQSEYDAGHIPGAVLLPVGAIDETTAAEAIPAQDTVVLVYCRNGNRSKTAAETLARLGYTQVYEFGGIQDWPCDAETASGISATKM